MEDSKGKNYSGSKKLAFFAKHKDSITSEVAKTVKKREGSEGRQASRDRLYN